MSGNTDWLLTQERYVDPLEATQLHLDGRQAQIHTAMPATIVAFDPAMMTVKVQPAVQMIRVMPDGSRQPMTITELHDVPVVFPGGGGHLLTFPIQAGDDCLVVFAERSIDHWWQLGGTQTPSDWRMHDINDGFALVGVRSQPKVPGGGNGRNAGAPVSATTVQLRSDDGLVVVDLDPAMGQITLHAMNIEAGQSGGKLGVLGATPIVKATISGSCGGNVPLKSLLQFLQTRGDLTDNTTP